jgi:hypothetical protein
MDYYSAWLTLVDGLPPALRLKMLTDDGVASCVRLIRDGQGDSGRAYREIVKIVEAERSANRGRRGF